MVSFYHMKNWAVILCAIVAVICSVCIPFLLDLIQSWGFPEWLVWVVVSVFDLCVIFLCYTALKKQIVDLQENETQENKRYLNASEEVPRWVRYGHTRKPNAIVRGLYVVFDWIGDFGPMFSSLFRFIKKTVVGTWDLLVRVFMVWVNIAILAGILYVSVGHSYYFLTFHAGMSGVAAWVFVAVWETVFVYCSLVIDSKYRRGKKTKWWDWAGFIMGWLFVEVSNYMGMANNWYGKAIGLATPILLLVMKKVLQYQFKNEEESAQEKQSWFSFLFKERPSANHQMVGSPTEKQPQIQPKTVEHSTGNVVADPVENAVGFTGKMVEKTVENAVENPVENLLQNRIEPVAETVEKTVEEMVENATEKGDQKTEEIMEKTVEESTANAVAETTEKVDEKQPVETASNPVVSTDSADIETTENDTISTEEKEAITTEEPVGETVEKAVAETVENATEFPVENDAEKEQKNNRDPVAKTTANEEEKVAVEDQKTTKKATKRTLKKDSNLKLKKSIKRWALDYFQKNGKPPGRVIIEKEFGVNQNQARLVANEIKKELGIKAS